MNLRFAVPIGVLAFCGWLSGLCLKGPAFCGGAPFANAQEQDKAGDSKESPAKPEAESSTPKDEKTKSASAKSALEDPALRKHRQREKPNKLISEKSPYLLQHAYNPVDWYPWGKEAFAKAKAENKPIFLSIGYSTCHWCHVMEHESFEDKDIAEYLNKNFVCIKVDREERPDVDGVYMDICQMMNRRGGWPLSVFLTPEKHAFFAGTYFPPASFKQLTSRVVEVWNDKELHGQIVKQAESISATLRKQVKAPVGGSKISSEASAKAFEWYATNHDPIDGGFGTKPKFPRTSNLDFLLAYAARVGEGPASKMVFTTLDHMMRGGMYDHLGRGFHRYSTDKVWLVPHFEKMLYDNALIPRTLVNAYRVSGNEEYLEVAKDTLDYLIERMQSKEGPFYSAEDADTEGREGTTYLWRHSQVIEALGAERGERFAEYFGVSKTGNFVDPHFPDDKTNCVIHVAYEGGIEAFAKKLDRPVEEVRAELDADKATLFALREKRPQPFLDDKILVEWNGLAISGLAQTYQVSGEKRYLEAAQQAAGYILDKMVIDGDRLQRRARGGEVAIDGFLEDYAFLVDGLLDLYESDFDRRWLEASVSLGKAAITRFRDPKSGAFFSSHAEHESLIARRVEFYDGAVPSGNSVMYRNLLRLREITFDKSLDLMITAFESVAGAQVSSSPQAYPQLMCGVEFRLAKPLEIVVVGAPDDELTRAMLAEIRGRYLPSKVVLHVATADEANSLAKLAPLLEYKMPIGGKPTAYVCRDQVCKLPAKDLETLKKQLDEASVQE